MNKILGDTVVVSYPLKEVLGVLPDIIYAEEDYYRLMIWVCENFNSDDFLWYVYRGWYYCEGEELEILCQKEAEDIRDLVMLISNEIQEFEIEVPEKFTRNKQD